MRPGFPLPDVTWEPLVPFWAAAERGELRIPRCDSCGAFVWYPRKTCRSCGGQAITWDRVSGRGRIFSWVLVRHAFVPQFASLVPFATGLVALEEDPAVRLATRFVDCEPCELAVDAPVEAVFRDLSFPGVPGSVRAPLFRPVH